LFLKSEIILSGPVTAHLNFEKECSAAHLGVLEMDRRIQRIHDLLSRLARSKIWLDRMFELEIGENR
jgi:hypothetical protein